MALFTKQDFSPPLLSRKWIAIKFRPNMLLYSRHHVISILESGLLFREDSVEVEQGTPSGDEVWSVAGGGRYGWLTKGEGILATVMVAGCFIIFPPRSLQKTSLMKIGSYFALPVIVRAVHRRACSGSALMELLSLMRDYLALARRAAACLKEYSAVHTQLGSISSTLESTHTMLRRQQSSLSVLMSRASSALLGNAPWLRADLAWEAVRRDHTDTLQKIHHAFLVVQSTLLKHIAMAHFIPPLHTRKLYKNHNEHIYWIHNVLIKHLIEEFKENFEALDRMYRLLKNYGNADINLKKPGAALNYSWFYSDVHTCVAKSSLELKIALSKSVNLDKFLDSCALHKQELDLEVLSKDLDDLIEDVTKCLTTIQHSQVRLKKLKNKYVEQDISATVTEVKVKDNGRDNVLVIEDKEPEIRDEVFYFHKTDDDYNEKHIVSDITTAPGKKEKEATKIVLSELKRKLVRREDIMRERERQALLKTMPEFKDKLPEFPRQINVDNFDTKGYISKIKRLHLEQKFEKVIKHRKRKHKHRGYMLKKKLYNNLSEISEECYEANTKKNKELVTVAVSDGVSIVTIWYKDVSSNGKLENCSSEISERLSDEEASAVQEIVNLDEHKLNNGEAKGYKFSKQDLELTPSSDSDFEHEDNIKLLDDIRRHRAVRKKNFPSRRSLDKNDLDESLKPAQYSFGTAMALASVLQVNNKARMPHMVQEEVFIGNGEVSEDSGNDEDA